MSKDHSVVSCLPLNLLTQIFNAKTSHNISNVQKYHDFFVHAKNFEQHKKHCTNKIISKWVAVVKPILNNNLVDLTLHSFFVYFVYFFSTF